MTANTTDKNDKNIELARSNMIEQQIRPAEVLDQRVLETISDTPREAFVPETYQDLAFSDINVDLGNAEVMMKPIMEARILQALNIQPGDKILEIGTGSGYLTALLAKLGGHVESVEIEPKILEQAKTRLGNQGITNITLVQGDASGGWNQNEAFDVIAITGSFPILPESFQKQLTVGGRMAVIVGESPVMETLLITRAAEDQWVTQALFETDFPALKNVEQPQAFIF
ncbi:MAG: protein-L-isoaspartate O-methyltransferase [Gammaproteobacteria bacterium]|nr:protein-L-isoaspartate O-methyltransferase [Gammaproteobacteria bacterium]